MSTSAAIRALALVSGMIFGIASGCGTVSASGPSTPTFSPGPGNYSSATMVTLSDSDKSSSIYYTTDGSTPSASSTWYSGPVSLSASATVKAIAVANGFASNVASGTYTISTPAEVVIAVTPASTSITTGATQQFSASVAGSSSSAVTWTVFGTDCSGTACGTISPNGLYTAPAIVPSSPIVTITSTSVSDPTKSASAQATIVPPQAAGYHLAWKDTFSTLSLCTTNAPGCNWYNPGLWWQSAAGTITDPSGTYVNLEWANGQAYNTNISTTSPNAAYYHAWTYGYFEVSMKFNPATGSAPAIWMFAEQGITGGANSISGELDIFEWQSSSPNMGYGTAHVWQNGANLVNTNNSDSWVAPAGTDWSKYNTYGVLLTPTSISWYFNNVLVETLNTTSVPFSKVYGGSESYFLILSQQAACNWTSPCPGQVSPLNMQVQWVHVYAPPS